MNINNNIMDFNQAKKKFIGISIFAYIGMFFGWVSLFLNDKLRVDMEEVEKKGIRKDKFKEIHERNAASYEKKSEFLEFRNQIHKYRRILLSHAKGRVLELGVGTGRSLEFYKSDVEEVVCIDHSSNMLNQAIEKYKDKEEFRIKQNNVTFKLMDAESMTFEENSFDTVVEFMNLHCYSDYNSVIKNIKRVLKDNGILIVLARGQSSYMLIREFYTIFKPFYYMKHGYY